MENAIIEKRGRGKGKKAAKTHVNLRLPVETLEFYKRFPNYTSKMREVLVEFASRPQDPATP